MQDEFGPEQYKKLEKAVLDVVIPTLPTTITTAVCKEPISVSFTVNDIQRHLYLFHDEAINMNYEIFATLWFKDGERKRSYPILFTYRPYTNSLDDILSYTSQRFMNAMRFFNNETDYTWWVQHYDECHPEKAEGE